jgi:HD-GYP domain-containing protein (c-di-GMP phosphodiesterase class II)
MAGVSSYLGNTLLVATAVGLQRGMNPLGVWLSSWRYDISEHVALYLLGILTALLAQDYSWALWLMAVPLAIVYISLQRSVHLRVQTKEAIEALADIVDMRDPYTFAHSKRVAEYAYELARAMKLSPQEVELIASAARVHDLGKVGIVEAVLNNAGKLDERQWKEMRRHPQMGAQIVNRFPYYAEGRELILHHHERMDGCGYPDGVSAEQLSMGTKIIAAADALDAMTSDRPYRKALPMDVVRQEFEKGSGTQWDARVVEQLLGMLPNGRAIKDMPPPFAELAARLGGDGSTRGA